MALSGSFHEYPVKEFGLYCEWSALQSITGNYSDVTLNVYLSYYTLSVGERSDSNINIAGDNERYTAPAIKDYTSGYKKKLLKSKTVRVWHDGDGNATCYLGASWRFDGTYSGKHISWIEATTTVSLDKIDRAAPSVSISASNITTNSVTVSASASTTCDVWEYSTNDGGSWTQYSTTATTSTSKTITGLSPNTSYTIKVRARKKSNQVYGSGGSTIKTLGPAVLNSVSTLTADNETASLTFNWTVYSTAFTYTLAIKNDSTTILTIIIPAQSSTGISNKTITLASAQRTTLLSYMANMKSFTGTFVLTTLSGGTQIGSASNIMATVQTTSANSAPTFSGFSYQDSNATTSGITGNNQLLVKGYSWLSITASTATAKSGAVVMQYEATIDGTTVKSSSTTLSVGLLKTAGNLTLTVKAIDSRGYEKSVSKTISVIDYEKISVASCTMRRVNEVEAITQVSFEADISKILVSGSNKNALSILRYRYKKTSDTAYGSYTTITSKATAIDTKISFSSNEFVSLDPDYSYDIQFWVYDKLTNDYFTVTLPSGTPLLSKRRKKLGINNRRPQKALDVVGGLKIDALTGVLKATNGIVEKAIAGKDYAEPTADYIVNQGTSGIWFYRIWASGLRECWGRIDKTLTVSTAYGNGYYNGSVLDIAPPDGLFSSDPDVWGQVRPYNAQIYGFALASVQKTSIAYYITSDKIQSSGHVYISLYARQEGYV